MSDDESSVATDSSNLNVLGIDKDEFRKLDVYEQVLLAREEGELKSVILWKRNERGDFDRLCSLGDLPPQSEIVRDYGAGEYRIVLSYSGGVLAQPIVRFGSPHQTTRPDSGGRESFTSPASASLSAGDIATIVNQAIAAHMGQGSTAPLGPSPSPLASFGSAPLSEFDVLRREFKEELERERKSAEKRIETLERQLEKERADAREEKRLAKEASERAETNNVIANLADRVEELAKQPRGVGSSEPNQALLDALLRLHTERQSVPVSPFEAAKQAFEFANLVNGEKSPVQKPSLVKEIAREASKLLGGISEAFVAGKSGAAEAQAEIERKKLDLEIERERTQQRLAGSLEYVDDDEGEDDGETASERAQAGVEAQAQPVEQTEGAGLSPQEEAFMKSSLRAFFVAVADNYEDHKESPREALRESLSTIAEDVGGAAVPTIFQALAPYTALDYAEPENEQKLIDLIARSVSRPLRPMVRRKCSDAAYRAYALAIIREIKWVASGGAEVERWLAPVQAAIDADYSDD